MGFLGKKKSKKKKKSKSKIEDDSDASVASNNSKAKSVKDDGDASMSIMSKVEEEASDKENERKKLDAMWRDAKTAFGLGKVNIEMKEYPEARQNFSESMSMYVNLMAIYSKDNTETDSDTITNKKKLRKRIADCRVQLGDVAIVLGDYGSAKMYYGEAQNVYEQDEYVLELNLVHKRTADIAFFEGEDELAKEIYTDAVSVLEKEEYLGWAHVDIGKIYKSLAELHLDDEEWDECLRYYRNAASAMQNAEEIGEKHPDYGEVMYSHGFALVTLGDSIAEYDEINALEQYKFAISPLKVAKQVYFDINRKDLMDELGSAYYYLGYCYAKLGKNCDAIECFENEIKIIDKLDADVRPSPDHVAQSLEHLGTLYLFISPVKAVSVLRKSLKIIEKLDDNDQNIIFRVLHKLSKAFSSTNETEEALKCLEDALRIAKKKDGKISHDYARTEVRRGHCYSDLHMYPTSIKRFETALQIYLKLAGDLDEDDLINELDYVETLVQLGHVHYTANSFDKALGCYLEVLRSDILKENRMSATHKLIQDNMGQLYTGLGDYMRAANCYKEALKLTTTEISTETASLLNNLGNVLFHLRSFKDAQHFYLRALKIKKQLSDTGIDNEVASAIFNMGSVCLKLNEFDDAVAYFERAKEIHSALSADSLQVAEVCSQMGNAYFQMKQYESALRELHVAYTIRTEKLSQSNEDVCATCHHIANICYAQEMYDKALSFYNTALETAVNSDLKGNILHGLGNTYAKINDYDAAAKAYQKSLDFKRLGQPISSSVAKTTRNLAMLLKDIDALEAEKLIEETIEITKAVMMSPTFMLIKLYADKSKILVSCDGHFDRAIRCLVDAESIVKTFELSSDRLVRRELRRAWRKVGGKPEDIDALIGIRLIKEGDEKKLDISMRYLARA